MDRYSNHSPNYSQNFNTYSSGSTLNNDDWNTVNYQRTPERTPLTKKVNQLAYDIPNNKYATNPWNYAPQFLKVFGDVKAPIGGQAIFDCVLLGSPRPKVCWLLNDEKLTFADVKIEDTADLCRLSIPYVEQHHYGIYTVICENEVGRAVAAASLLPL
ncbi:hypothetical protein AB6A40_009099 [Gnathostoma spinigerum]|uniref:Ig-like domain-containing protein n=1 Tax=Gnathostoma spinigerum TaxID=75299 RepID=A0ABD6ES66_9BILA